MKTVQEYTAESKCPPDLCPHAMQFPSLVSSECFQRRVECDVGSADRRRHGEQLGASVVYCAFV